MKKLSKFLAIALSIAAIAPSCVKDQINTDQLADEMMCFSSMAPVPVVRGAELRIYGSGLDKVVAVEISGVGQITDIEHVKTDGKLKEIRIIVPKDGPEEGKVTIIDKDGNRSSSKFNLTYDETALVFDGFEAADVVMPGDVITIKGDYINTVKEVIFTGGADGNGAYAVGESIFDQTRYSAKVTVPADAITGIIKVGTINEVVDKNSIPTIFPSSKELTVGEPTVDPIGELEAKVGDVIIITGKYLNMIKAVKFTGADGDDFLVNTAADQLGVTVPEGAQQGEISLISYADRKYVPEGQFFPVLPGNLKIAPDNKEERYKANLGVLITGEDLSIVSAISFGGVDVYDFLFTPGTPQEGEKAIDEIRCTIPELAPDGEVVVKMKNGDAVTVTTLELVKPTFTDVGPTTIVARETFDLHGADLELIKGLTIGGIECTVALDSIGVRPGFDEDNQPVEIPVYDSTCVHVTTHPEIVSGDVVISLLNGYTEVINEMEVHYNEKVSFTYESPSIKLGNPLTIIGDNLFMVESIRIKGKKVTNYLVKENGKMSFFVPDGLGPNTYKLELTLIDGEVLTWAIPFTMTAPYTETIIWEGPVTLTGWANNELGSETAWVDAGVELGNMVRFYVTPTSKDWVFQVFDGHWGGMRWYQFNPNTADLSLGYIDLEVTDEVYAFLTDIQGWGSAMIFQGEGAILEKFSLIKWGESEKVETIWEGSSTVTWSGGAVTALSWGGYDWSQVQAGTKLRVEFSVDDASGVIRLGNGSWVALPSSMPFGDAEGNVPVAGLTKFEIELADADLNELVSNGGLVVCGTGFTCTAISLVGSAPAPSEKTVWEGETDITWNVGGRVIIPASAFEGVKAGSIMTLYYTQKDQVWGQAQINNGAWVKIPFTEGEIQLSAELVPTDIYGWFSDGVLDRATPLVLSQDVLDNILANRADCDDEGAKDCGIIIQGSDLIFTKVTIQ